MKKLLLFGALAFGLNAFGQVPDYVPTNGLIGWWPFNGNANDESGNGNNGTVSGAVLTTDRFSNTNSAYEFDGVDNYIEISYPITSYSYSFWFKRNTAAISFESFVWKSSTSSFQYCETNLSNDLYSRAQFSSGNPIDVQPGITINQSNWYHCVFIFNEPNKTIDVYINGVHYSSSLGSGGSFGSFPTDIFYLGGRPFLNNNYLNGKMDDFGLWNRELSDCEIEELYNSQVTIDNSVNQSGATLIANQFAPGYQWLDCDNNYAIINGETSQSYTASNTGNYAVEITVNNCLDTSDCYLVDFTGIEELLQTEKKLVKIVDFMGRETEFKPNTPLIFIYSDGTRERVVKLEE